MMAGIARPFLDETTSSKWMPQMPSKSLILTICVSAKKFASTIWPTSCSRAAALDQAPR